jgi:hypothetical protein
MSEESTFDLEKIVRESTKKLKKISGSARTYLVSIANKELQRRLTTTEAFQIAQELLKKMGVESQCE